MFFEASKNGTVSNGNSINSLIKNVSRIFVQNYLLLLIQLYIMKIKEFFNWKNGEQFLL
uniref:Uncharacterized protein n=1 Tax=Heterorhabditis bacteriophora TaxID=37862 RepID=A0A1I7W9G2_HETBA